MDAFIIAVVAFSQCVSLAAIMAKKHNYTFDANQVIKGTIHNGLIGKTIGLKRYDGARKKYEWNWFTCIFRSQWG